jgi:transcriptional regulator with XRE-family HTH domain
MTNDLNRCLGQLIKLQRKIQKMSIKDISEKTRYSISNIYKYESNKMTIPCRFLFIFSKAVNVNVDFFYESFCKKKDFNFEKDVDSQTLKLLQSFAEIKDTKQKQVFFERIQNLILNRECYL